MKQVLDTSTLCLLDPVGCCLIRTKLLQKFQLGAIAYVVVRLTICTGTSDFLVFSFHSNCILSTVQ